MNEFKDFGDFYISWNSYVRETALVFKGEENGKNTYFILDGNHLSKMVEAGENGGKDACIDYYLKNIVFSSRWTEFDCIVDSDKQELYKKLLGDKYDICLKAAGSYYSEEEQDDEDEEQWEN